MRRQELQHAQKYIRRRGLRSIWKKLAGFMAGLVVFTTTYALILPAITQEVPTGCSVTEHVHEEACYAPGQEQLICQLETQPVHTHEEICYETAFHTHAEACYQMQQGALICSNGEEGHLHNTDCYEWTALTVCGLEEGAQTQQLICQEPEIPPHTHEESCYEISVQLICEELEHSHALACYADPNEDLETAQDWESMFASMEFGGPWNLDVLTVAQSQLGYQESEKNYIVLADGETLKGYTRYGAWCADPYGDWNAMFAAFCLHYAGAEEIPLHADAASWADALADADWDLYRNATGHIPTSGDLVFLDEDEDGKADRVGIVARWTQEESSVRTVQTIEGDTNGSVQYREHSGTAVLGYGDIAMAWERYLLKQPVRKTYADEQVTVTVTYLPSAGIPEEAVLTVEELVPEEAEYTARYQEAQAVLDAQTGTATTTEIQDFRLYDISFRCGEEEIEPLEPVRVEISLQAVQATETAEVSVVHYAQAGPELPENQDCSVDEEGNLNASFETEGFSLFAIVTSQTAQTPVVAFKQHQITSTNLRNLASAGTMAIVSGNHALTVDSNRQLTVTELLSLENGGFSGVQTAARWTFERVTNSTFRLRTTIDNTTYYLYVTGNGLTLSATGTTFTASQSGTNLRLSSGNSYINLSASGVSLGNAQDLGLYYIPSGPFTVVFDGQIGLATYNGSSNKKYDGAGKLTLTTDSDGYVTLPTDAEVASTPNYAYKINGWYDIINQVYYDKTMLGQQIRVTSNTTFYPDWIAKSYDIGQNVDVVPNQPDTSDFINTYVFDYSELFNVHSSTYSQSTGKWTFDPDSELGFIFFDYLNQDGNIGDMLQKNVAVDGVTVNAEKTNGKRGSSINFPGTITEGIANDVRLDALFGSNNVFGANDTPILGRMALGEGDWLYSFDNETGYYYYNSARNAAAYNQSKQRFYVYNHTVNIDSQNSLNDFLPFNYDGTGKTTYKEKDTEANYWFGMKSEITFYLPADSGTGKNQASSGDDMQFRFSGDDDVWIFVDGKLVLDLGGVHDVVYGEINFSTGVIKTGQAISSSAVADNSALTTKDMPGLEGTAGITTSTLPTLAGGVEHTLTVCYLERGSSLSNCAIYFNLSPFHELQITKYGEENGKSFLAEGVQFQIFEDAACTKPSTLFQMRENGSLELHEDAIFTTDEKGVLLVTGLMAGRTYYLKEITPILGYPDMSDYVIRLDLSDSGDETRIVLDSDGNTWSFAGAYHHSNVEGGGINSFFTALDVYNEKMMGGKQRLYVQKVWSDGSGDSQQPITVRLYANGTPTERTLILKPENGWQGMFYALPDKDENGTITYTVQEEGLASGYTVSYESITHNESVEVEIPGQWVQTGTLEAGRKYLLIANNQALGTASSSSELFRWTNAATVLDQEEETNSWQWTAIQNGGGFSLRSGDGRVLRLWYNESTPNVYTSTDLNDNSGNATSVMYYTNGKFRMHNYYISGTHTSGNYANKLSVSSDISSGLNFTLYVWEEAATDTETDTIPGWRITNTAWPTTIAIPVQKQWESIVPEAERTPVMVTLYQVTEDPLAVTVVDSLVLNAANGWRSSFDNLPRPPEGAWYGIAEITEGFDPSYSGQTQQVLIDGRLRELACIAYDTAGNPVTLTVTNSALILLPNTGGTGTTLYTMAGLALIIGAVCVLYITWRRKEGSCY